MLAPKARAALDRLSNGLDFPMLVVTAEADGERAGCLVGFAPAPLDGQLGFQEVRGLRPGHPP
jgi:hypothetical protein